MAGPFDLPVETPSKRFRRRGDVEPRRFRRRTDVPTVPTPTVPSVGFPNIPGIVPPMGDTGPATPSFREAISGTRDGAAQLPGWGAYLRREDWQKERSAWDPRRIVEPLSYPGIRHIMNLGASEIEKNWEGIKDIFNPPSNEERKLRRYAAGYRPDDSFLENLRKIGIESFGDESHYVKRHFERPFLESMALSVLDPTFAVSKLRYVGGARIGISDDLLRASRSADWIPTYTSPLQVKLDNAMPKFWVGNRQMSANELPPSYFDEWFGVGKVESVVAPIPDFNEFVKLQYQTPSHKKWRQFLDFKIGGVRPFNAPLRVAASLFNEGAIAEDPVAWADIWRQSMDDVIEANMFAATVKVRAMGQAPREGVELLGVRPRRLTYAKPLIPIDDTGAVLPASKITQRRGLGPEKIKSVQLHDIVENLDHYDIPDVQMKKYLQEVRNVSKQFAKMLDDEPGIAIKRLKGEEDFVYLHRVVKTYQNHLGDEYAAWIQKTLKEKGFVSVRKPGENAWDYIVRVFEEMQGTQLLYPELGGQTTTRGFWSRLGPDELDEFTKIMEDLGDLFTIDVKKGRLDQRRTIDYVVNGIKRARKVTYETDITKELEAQGNMAYRMVVNQRIKNILSEFAVTKDEFIEGVTDGDRLHRLMGITGKEPGLRARTAHASSRLGALDRLTAAVGAAIEGAGLTNKKRTTTYVLSNRVWNIIEAEYPELAAQWERITSMDIVNVNQVIRNLTKEVTEFNGLTTTKFREYLLDFRMAKFMDDFPSMADSPTVAARGRRMTGVPIIGGTGLSVRPFYRRKEIRTLIQRARKILRDAGADRGKALRSVGMPEDLVDAWRKGLEEIEAGIRRGQVTQRELSGVFQRHNKDAKQANKMLKAIYEDEFEKNVTRRRERVTVAPEDEVIPWNNPTTTLGETRLPKRAAGDSVEVDVFHGTDAPAKSTSGLPEIEPPTRYSYGGLHFGTEKAAQDYIRDSGMRAATGRVVPARVHLNKPYGSIDNPISESELWDSLARPDAIQQLKDEGFDGIIYRNTAEDPGSISYWVFDPENALVTRTRRDVASAAELSGDPSLLFDIRNTRPGTGRPMWTVFYKGTDDRLPLSSLGRASTRTKVQAEKIAYDEAQKIKTRAEGMAAPTVTPVTRTREVVAEALAPSAVFENPETRGQLLAALKESTKGLRDTEDKLLTSLRQRRSEILTKGGLGEAGAIGEEWGQGVGVPGVSGKYVPAQIIKDSLGIERVVSGPELAGMITERFGYARHAADTTWQQVWLSKLTTFSTVYRMGKASFDLGLQFLQLSGLLGLDFANLISGTAGATADMLTDSMSKGKAGWLGENFMKPAGPRFTNTFLPATKATFWSFFDPEYSLAYWMKPENYATLSERARYGSLVQPSELFLGVDTVEQTLERLARWQGGNDARLRKNTYMDMVRGKAATAAPWGKTAFKQSYGRADAAWSAGRNVAANELWKAYAPFAAKTGNLHDLARMTNLMTGVLSLKGMGTSSFKRNLLNALGFFSPRYTYAQFAMVGHLLKGNGYTAKQARQMVVGTIAFNTTFFTLAAMALGQTPKIDPRPKRLGGDGADLWTVQVGDKRIGVGGLIYAPMKLMMDTLGMAVDEPSALASFDMTNPILRAYRGKSAGITSEAWSLISGRDFIGEPTRDTPDDIKDYLSTVMAPIWSEELITEGKGAWPTALADFHGLRGRPEGKWDLYHQSLEEATAKRSDEISNYEKRIYRETVPSVKEAYDLAIKDSEERGRNPEAGEYWNRYEGYRGTRDGYLETYNQGILENRLTYGIQARKYIQDVNATFRAQTEALRSDERYENVVADFSGDEPKFPVDAAYAEYWRLWYDPRFIDEELGLVDFEGRDGAIAQWREAVDPKVLAMVDAWNDFNRARAPMLLQEYWRDQARLKDYWNVNRTITNDLDLQTKIAWQGFLDADRILQRSMMQQNPLLGVINSMRDNERQKMRMLNPALDVALLRWGYTTVPLTAEGWEFYEAQAYGMDPAVPSMTDAMIPQFDTSDYPSLEKRNTTPPRRFRRRTT